MRFRNELNEEQLAKGLVAETDLFQRRDLALRLTGLFDKLEHGTVSLLDGRWGTGKTTFVKQWMSELVKLGVPSIYFDAFANDYIESPFEAVSASFIKAAIDAKRTDQPSYKNFLRNIYLGLKNEGDLDEKALQESLLKDSMFSLTSMSASVLFYTKPSL